MAQLYRVLYCSRNCIPGSPELVASQIRNILAASRANNSRVALTGALLFSAGCFAQALEGPLDVLEDTFERIQCDERHSDVTVLHSAPITAREFPAWSMGFAGAAGGGGPLSDVVLSSALRDQSSAGQELLATLKAVVVRENDWLAPVGHRAGSGATRA